MTGMRTWIAERPGMAVVVAGEAPPVKGAHAELALILATYAIALGFHQVGVKASRISISRSRYLQFDDDGGRRWKLRISDHLRRPRGNQGLPHFDLVSLDGKAGLEPAKRFLDQVAAGSREWTDLGRVDARPKRWGRR